MAAETIRIEGLKGVLDTLNQLPPELVSVRGGPVRKALRNAAKVIQKAAQDNVQRIIDQPNAHGLPTHSVGLLKKSIVISRGRQPVEQKGERVFVKIKRGAKYPPELQDKTGKLTAAQVGRLLETGTERRHPMPWIRPAFEATKVQAVNDFVTNMDKEIAKVLKKLEAKNRVKK